MHNKLVIGSLLLIKNKITYNKSNVPMTDATPLNKTSKLINLKSKLARPSKDTLFFLQMFARMYQPQMVMGVA